MCIGVRWWWWWWWWWELLEVSQCLCCYREAAPQQPAGWQVPWSSLRLSWDSPAQIISLCHTLLLLLAPINVDLSASLRWPEVSDCSGEETLYYRPGVWGGSEAVMCPLDRTPLLGATVVGSLPATSHHGTHTPTATVRHGVMESFYWLIAASHQQTELW